MGGQAAAHTCLSGFPPSNAMQFYHIKNWSEFQHYKERNPPWIKLHFEILTSPDWVTLDDASRVLAVACMLVASRNEGKVPSDPHYMKRVAYLNTLPKFKPLIDCGFLENPQADASIVLTTARPETETYSKETDKETERVVRVTRGTRLPENFELEQEWGDWAEEQGLSGSEVIKEGEKFKDYWTAKAGKMAIKTNWQATWRNWIRSTLERKNNELQAKKYTNK